MRGPRTIEDSIDYLVEKALKRYIEDFETPEQAKEYFSEAEHYDKFLDYIDEGLHSYTDLDEELDKMIAKIKGEEE